MVLNQIKKTLSSESPGLLWVMSSLLLLIVTLSMIPFMAFYPKVMFTLFTVFAVIAAYRWKMVGAFSGIAALFIAYLILSIFTVPEHLMWDLGWMISLASGILLFVLSHEDFSRNLQKQLGQLEIEIVAQKGSYRELENEKKSQLESFEDKYAKLSSDLQKQEDHMKSYQNLIDATKIETEKFLFQNQKLVDESLIFHRTIVQLEKEIRDGKEAASRYLALEQKSQIYAEKIDKFELLLEEEKTKYITLQASLHAAKQRTQELEQSGTDQSGDVELFYEKEVEKKQIKYSYDLLFSDYNLLKTHLAKIMGGDKQDPECETKKKELEEKKVQLKETKKRLVDLDRELFILRKEIQDQGISLHHSIL